MRIHYIQHVPFEDAANIARWARERGHEVTRTLLFENEPLPAQGEFDRLVIMGGPMGADDEETFPWLKKEKEFIRETIDAGVPVIGVCLGAQLMARVLGARVTRNEHREIGWFPVSLTEEARSVPFLKGFPDSFEAFHWHGDTFEIPEGAMRLAESEGCRNQAFLFGANALGLQFHLDYDRDAIERMITCCTEDLVEGPFVQIHRNVLCNDEKTEKTKELLYKLLDSFEAALAGK